MWHPYLTHTGTISGHPLSRAHTRDCRCTIHPPSGTNILVSKPPRVFSRHFPVWERFMVPCISVGEELYVPPQQPQWCPIVSPMLDVSRSTELLVPIPYVQTPLLSKYPWVSKPHQSYRTSITVFVSPLLSCCKMETPLCLAFP